MGVEDVKQAFDANRKEQLKRDLQAWLQLHDAYPQVRLKGGEVPMEGAERERDRIACNLRCRPAKRLGCCWPEAARYRSRTITFRGGGKGAPLLSWMLGRRCL